MSICAKYYTTYLRANYPAGAAWPPPHGRVSKFHYCNVVITGRRDDATIRFQSLCQRHVESFCHVDAAKTNKNFIFIESFRVARRQCQHAEVICLIWQDDDEVWRTLPRAVAATLHIFGLLPGAEALLYIR